MSDPLGFLELIYQHQGQVVILAGGRQFVARSRLGIHIQLERLSAEISKSLVEGDHKQASNCIKEYLSLAGLEIPEQAMGTELLLAYRQLRKLNALRQPAAFMLEETKPGRLPPYDYLGRQWALWVHKFASRYGWTPDEIWQLWPEEAGYYMQEIIVSEYDDADAQRALSQVTYRYNKSSKKYTWHPLPRPTWMVRGPAKPRRIRKTILPVGHIIKLE